MDHFYSSVPSYMAAVESFYFDIEIVPILFLFNGRRYTCKVKRSTLLCLLGHRGTHMEYLPT